MSKDEVPCPVCSQLKRADHLAEHLCSRKHIRTAYESYSAEDHRALEKHPFNFQKTDDRILWAVCMLCVKHYVAPKRAPSMTNEQYAICCGTTFNKWGAYHSKCHLADKIGEIRKKEKIFTIAPPIPDPPKAVEEAPSNSVVFDRSEVDSLKAQLAERDETIAALKARPKTILEDIRWSGFEKALVFEYGPLDEDEAEDPPDVITMGKDALRKLSQLKTAKMKAEKPDLVLEARVKELEALLEAKENQKERLVEKCEDLEEELEELTASAKEEIERLKTEVTRLSKGRAKYDLYSR